MFTYTNGEKCLPLSSFDPANLVDILMPKLNGFHVLKKSRSSPAKFPSSY
jgi:hypothetical protein